MWRDFSQRGKKNKALNRALEEGFASVTSVKSKKAIRKTGVFKEAKGTSGYAPTPDKVKLVRLKAAGSKAAGNYLGEYKLMAIKAGHQWSDQS